MPERYVEMVIDGPSGWDIGFIRGYLRGKGQGGMVLDAEEEGFDCKPGAGVAEGPVAPVRTMDGSP